MGDIGEVIRIKRTLVGLFLGLLLAESSVFSADYLSQSSPGYFEGVLRFVVSRYSTRSGKVVQREQINALATEKRLSIPSLDLADVFANNAPPGVSSALFRHDKDDFILYGDGVDAYRFRGHDKVLLGYAFRGLALAGAPVDMSAPEKLGPFQLRGFKTYLYRYHGEGDIRYDMYFSRDYNVNWGAIADSWLFGKGGLKVEELDSLLDRGELPVRIEVYRSGSRLLSINLMEAEEFSVSRASVEVPAQKILHSSSSLLKKLASEAIGLGP